MVNFKLAEAIKFNLLSVIEAASTELAQISSECSNCSNTDLGIIVIGEPVSNMACTAVPLIKMWFHLNFVLESSSDYFQIEYSSLMIILKGPSVALPLR